MVTGFEKQYAAGGIKRSALEAHMAETRLACGIMAGSLSRAAKLITSFKQVSVDQTSDQRRCFALDEVVRDTVTTYAAQLRRANCVVEVDVPSTLLLDSYPGKLGQVLSNLINNALMHAFGAPAAPKIVISARAIEHGQLMLHFSDDGAGMTQKTLRQVFDPFFTTKLGQGGSGLGMNIVYNVVSAMLGGSIGIDSTPLRRPRRKLTFAVCRSIVFMAISSLDPGCTEPTLWRACAGRRTRHAYRPQLDDTQPLDVAIKKRRFPCRCPALPAATCSLAASALRRWR